MEAAVQLDDTWRKHAAETEAFKNSLRVLNDKIEEAKRKKNLLIARQRRAQAQKRIHETMSSMSEKSAFETFERMSERIEQNERKALAAAELSEELSGDSLAKQFEQLEYKADADTQLLALKQKMGLIGPGKAEAPKQIGAGQGDVHEAEIVDDAAEGDPKR